MHEIRAYDAPRSRFFRWIAEIGDDLPEEVQRRLRAAFFVSIAPLVIGAINSVAVAGVIYFRSFHPIFAVIAVCDLVLLGVRIALLKRKASPPGAIFATGLLWAILQGATMSLVVISQDLASSMLVMASGLGAIGGIVGRNFAAPRYAMAQVIILDASFKVSFLIINPQFMPLVALQSVVFLLMHISIIRQQRTVAIQAIRGEIESRGKSITDPLTELGNRRALEEAFLRMTSPMVDRSLLYLDLDGFKQVNDGLGHAVGDMLLREVGKRLRYTVGCDAIVCRLGGDEFLILTDCLTAAETRSLGARIIAAIALPYAIEVGVVARVGVSIGAVSKDADTKTLADLMLKADRALYTVKASGKGRCMFYGDAEGLDSSPGQVRDDEAYQAA